MVKVEVPDPLMFDELSAAVIPLGPWTLSDTDDVNPFSKLRLIVEVSDAPVLIESLDGLAEMLKSWKEKATVTE